MTFDDACAKALADSKGGFVQHVNATIDIHKNGMSIDQDAYYVSDWLDMSTVKSYENGKEL